MSKGKLHKRNIHQGRYDIAALVSSHSQLKPFVQLNPRGEQTIDFSDPDAVLELNRALLKHYYKINFWDIPKGYLCPPIPGRADYIHYAADLLLSSANKKNFKGLNVRALDIGTGANLIYPIIGSHVYRWSFTASEIDPASIKNANDIINRNKNLAGSVIIRTPINSSSILNGVINKDDYFQVTLCNPPFFKSKADAAKARDRKFRNLNRNKSASAKTLKSAANFGGSASELYCAGGELAFIKKLILESKDYSAQVGWFTTLVSNSSNLSVLTKIIQSAGCADYRVETMSQGQKSSRILAWTFKEPKRLKELLLL